MKKIFVLIFVLFSFFLCGIEKNSVSPIEQLKITEGTKDDAMKVVENNSESGNTFLRTVARDADIKNPLFHHLAARMRATLKVIPGVGIAATQVGIDRRIVIVQRMDKADKPFEVYFNPEITEYSKEVLEGWEGCLSIPAGFGKVKRPISITIAYDTEKGRKTEKIEGFTAVIFQHEIDHLLGKLFVDRKEPGDLMPKEKYYEMRKKEKEAKEKNLEQKTQENKEVGGKK